MVTGKHYKRNGTYYGATKLFGLSSDSKPTNYGNGTEFVEVDTGKKFYYDAENSTWAEEGGDIEFLSGMMEESPFKIGTLDSGDWVCSVIYPINLDITVAPDENNDVYVTSSEYTGAVVVLCHKVG